jgi:hypothetical protein
VVEGWFMVYVFRDRKGVRVRLWFGAKRLAVVGGSCCCKTVPSSIYSPQHTHTTAVYMLQNASAICTSAGAITKLQLIRKLIRQGEVKSAILYFIQTIRTACSDSTLQLFLLI